MNLLSLKHMHVTNHHTFINSEILYLVIRIFEILGDMAAEQALNDGDYNSTILVLFLSDEGVITAIAPFRVLAATLTPSEVYSSCPLYLSIRQPH